MLQRGLQYVETLLKEDMDTVASFREVRSQSKELCPDGGFEHSFQCLSLKRIRTNKCQQYVGTSSI